MIHVRGAIGAVLGLCLFVALPPLSAWAQLPSQPPGQVEGLIRENAVVPLKRIDQPPHKLDALMTRPTAPGRYPLMVISHGSPRDAAQRAEFRPTSYSSIAVEFARRGWAAVAVARRGYGRSEGDYVESNGPCDSPIYDRSGLISSQDLAATVEYFKTQDYIQPDRYLYIGVSAGGFASIAAASLPQNGLIGVVNFAGGRGSTAPDQVCRSDRLVNAMGAFGKTVRVPTLWIYSENDHFFGPDLARKMFTAFTSSGGPGEFIAAPAFGADGHALFGNTGMPIWMPMVAGFFAQNGFPINRDPVSEPPVKLAGPTVATDAAKKDFPLYLASNGFEKAFAIGANGKGFAWRTGLRTPEDAAAAAIKACAANGAECKVYALNNRLVN